MPHYTLHTVGAPLGSSGYQSQWITTKHRLDPSATGYLCKFLRVCLHCSPYLNYISGHRLLAYYTQECFFESIGRWNTSAVTHGVHVCEWFQLTLKTDHRIKLDRISNADCYRWFLNRFLNHAYQCIWLSSRKLSSWLPSQICQMYSEYRHPDRQRPTYRCTARTWKCQLEEASKASTGFSATQTMGLARKPPPNLTRGAPIRL